jgi:ABC-type phosphate/phosphonate transport system substrate-binding protein
LRLCIDKNRFRLLTWAPVLLLGLATLCSAEPIKFALAPGIPGPYQKYEKIVDNADSKVLKSITRYQKKPDKDARARAWTSAVAYLNDKTNLDIELLLPESQLQFERNLALGVYEVAYMTPIQFIAAERSQQYQALVKRKAEPLRGLVLVQQTDAATTLRDIENDPLGLPGLLRYSASVLPRVSLEKLGFKLTYDLYNDQDLLVEALLKGDIRSGSISQYTYFSLSPKQQTELKILWETPGFSPYAMAAHPRLPFYSINKLQRAFVNLSKNAEFQELLEDLHARNGFEIARNSDWYDAEKIDIDKLNHQVKLTPAP